MLKSELNYYVSRWLSRAAHRIKWHFGLTGIVVFVCVLAAANALSAESIMFTVEGKDVIARYGKNELLENSLYYVDPRSSSVRVVDTGVEVFEVTSSFVFLKFDEIRRYRELEPGGTYRAIVSGWRIPWLGHYRNIVEILEEPPHGG